MEVIAADGVHVGTVDRMEGKRIKLTKKDSGEGAHKGHHHFIDASLIAADVAVTMEQEKSPASRPPAGCCRRRARSASSARALWWCRPMCRRVSPKETLGEIARSYNVSRWTISRWTN
jgi:hypothetical protein